MKKLLPALLLLAAARAFGAAAAFDLVLTQRPDGGTGPNVERLVPATAYYLLGFDSSKHPTGVAATAYGLGIVGVADAAAARTYIGAGVGAGDVTASGSPTSGQWAKFTGATGITGFTPGTGVETFVVTPTLANLIAAVTSGTVFGSTTKSSALQAAELVTLTSSSTDTFAGTAGVTATAYTTGDRYTFKANTANTGAASLNVDGLGATTIVKVAGGVTTTLADNDIRVDQIVVVQYDGTNFQLQSTLGNAASGSAGTKTIAIMGPLSNEPPASNMATFGTRNNHPTLDFDTTTQEAAIWSNRVPEGTSLASGLTVYVQWCAATATSGTIGWDVAFERIVDGGIDIDSDNFGTAKTITAATVSGTSGITSVTSVNFAQADLPTSLAAGDMYRVRIRRDVANDTATGDAQLVQAEIRLQ